MKKAHKNFVILDVRNQSEYDLGHLYDAVLIPVYELENRINELQEHTNDPIIVYCKAGSRSRFMHLVNNRSHLRYLGGANRDVGPLVQVCRYAIRYLC